MMVSGIAKVSSLLRRYESFIYRGQGELEGQGRIGEREGGIGIGEGSRGVEGIGRVGEGGVGELEEGGVRGLARGEGEEDKEGEEEENMPETSGAGTAHSSE